MEGFVSFREMAKVGEGRNFLFFPIVDDEVRIID